MTEPKNRASPSGPLLPASGGVQSVHGNDNFGVVVDDTDPLNPVVNGVAVESQANVVAGGSGSNTFTFEQSTGSISNRGNGFFVSVTISLAASVDTDTVLVTLTDDEDNQIGPTARIVGSGSCTLLGFDTRSGSGTRSYTVTAVNQTAEDTVTVVDGELGFAFFAL